MAESEMNSNRASWKRKAQLLSNLQRSTVSNEVLLFVIMKPTQKFVETLSLSGIFPGPALNTRN
jgi:hypothetical protein